MTSFVILADDADGAAASRLASMGHAVRAARDVTRAQLAAARKVIVLWSRTARGTPALRAAARQAQARGKLVCVRLDAARPPVELGGARAVQMPGGRAESAAWGRLLRGSPRHAATPTAPAARAPLTTRRAVRRAQIAVAVPAARSPQRQGARLLASLTALALIVLAAGAEAYTYDASFAARLGALASDAQARATQLASEIAP